MWTLSCRMWDLVPWPGIEPGLSALGARSLSHWSTCGCSVAQSCLTLHEPMTAACQASLSLTISWSLPKFTFITSVMSPSHLILCRPLLLFTLSHHPVVSQSCNFCFFFFFSDCAAGHVGSQFPDQELNPHLLHWKLGVPTTEPPEKSLNWGFNSFIEFFFVWRGFVVVLVFWPCSTVVES